MVNPAEPFLVQAIQVIKFIGKLDNFPHSLIVKCSDNANVCLEKILDNSIRGEQHLALTQNECMLVEGSELNIEIRKKHSQLWKKLIREPGSEERPMRKASIKFDNLRKHLSSWTGTNLNFKVRFGNPIQELQLWLVIEVRAINLNTLDPQIKKMVVTVNDLQSVLHRLASASDVAGMFIELTTAISKLNPVTHAVLSCIEVVYKHLKTQKRSYETMKSLANSIQALSGQLSRLKEVPLSNELCRTIREFPVVMEEVVNFIERWLKSWMFKYIFVDSQKEKATELKEKLDAFKDKFDRDLLIEIRAEQAIMAKNVKMAANKKELEDLVSALGVNSSPLHKPCMQGTRTAILQKIENDIKNVDGHSVIWIRGSPGVGKSALAASIAVRLRKQGRHVISFRFDRTQSSTITVDALWRAVSLDLARLYPSVCQCIHEMVQGNMLPDPYDLDDRFNSLIETPLSTLNNIPRKKLPVIVVDALDECGVLRHDSSRRNDFEGLVHMLKRWVEVDHLKKLKLVITSRPVDRMTFPNSISIHEIPSGHGVKPGDNVSNDIRVFLKSRLDDMKMKPSWVIKALDFLVPGAAGIFIWATTVANFLERDPEGRFAMLEKGDGKGLKSLYSLYSTIIEASFGHDLEEEEIRAVVSVMGAMIFAKKPLDDSVLIMLPEVKIPGSDVDRLGLIRKGLMSVIDSGPVLRFHHRSFEDFLLSPSFPQQHPDLSDIQDQVYHERQLTVLCLRTLVSSKLHFNMCSLESSFVKNVDIQAAAKTTIPPLVSYSCQYWADHLIHAPSDETLIYAVKFVVSEKLLFWMEAMSLLSKAYEVALILRRALAWKTLSPNHELTLLICDALRFISAFIIPISQCAPQIYVSALSFAPEQSLVAKKFCSRFPNTVVVTEGKPNQWPMVVFTAEHHKDPVRYMIFSSTESIFASISTEDDTTMFVCDSETGQCISGLLELPGGNIHGACFSPDGKHILLKFTYHAVVLDAVTGKEQFQIKGWDFVFIHHGRRIASTYWIDGDGDPIVWGTWEDEGGDQTRLLVKVWDASNGALISNRLLEANDVAGTRFSPDGHFLTVERESEFVIELWNLEDGQDPRRFSYPPGNNVKSLHFSPTSDSLIVVSWGKAIYLWRLDTQEMASFDWHSSLVPRDICVIHSPLTNYLFIQRYDVVEIWDVSVTGSKLIWETNPPVTSPICSICPSGDGHRLLVGCEDGSVRMYNLDLGNLAMNQTDTMDTQADADMPQFIAFSPSGKMVATRSERSHSIEFLDTTTGEVVAHIGIDKDEDDMEIAFSPDEDQVAFWSTSHITICDIMHPDNRVSFAWLTKNVQIRRVAFQTCNDLVICIVPRDGSGLLQVWHRQDPTRFKCTYHSVIKVEKVSNILLAPDGLTVVIVPWYSSARYHYSWSHDTAQFHPVQFDDQVDIHWPMYSLDGRLFACSSCSHVRVWDTRTGQLVGRFPTSAVDAIALPLTLTEPFPVDRLITCRYDRKETLGLYDVFTGHLYAQILGRGSTRHAFIRDRTKLAYYSPDSGLRTWDVADLTDARWHSTHGYELMPNGMTNGWVVGRDNEPLFWVPVEHRDNLYVPSPRVVIGIPQKKVTSVDLSNSRLGRKWTECIDKEWLIELEREEKRVGNLLE